MIKRGNVYKCEVCGNVVEVLYAGGGELVCCGQPMKSLEPNTVDASLEKHVPVIEKTDEGIMVKVGEVLHPMEEKHYIMWIELVVDDVIYRKYLKPGDEPKALFKVSGEKLTAYEYCNLHGLWKKE